MKKERDLRCSQLSKQAADLPENPEEGKCI
jgi:hypothetical protein